MRTLWAALSLQVYASALAQLQPGQIESARIPTPQAHYQPEYTFDGPTDPSAWAKQESGLQAAFGETDELYLRCEPPSLNGQGQSWRATGWRGERLNAQVLVWSSEALEQVRVSASDLTNVNGQVIARRHVTLDLVRYVVSNFPYRATQFTCDVTHEAAYLVPDRLEPFERFDLPGRTVRPVWISFTIPTAIPPGEYRGTVRIDSPKHRTTLPVTLNVQSLTLPPPRDWRFRLDLWQNPWAVAWHFRVRPWSDEHLALLRRHLQAYADAGGKYITTYAVHSPWSDNSYLLEGTMIDWIKRADGSWTFDYRIFDQYVRLAMESGVDGAITIYTPLPWGHRFRYLDEPSGNHVDVEWPPDSEQFRTVWTVFLEDLKKHLVQRGWFGRTYLGINENPLEHTRAAVKVIKQHSKDWKITYAGDWHPELSPLLDDYSAVIPREPGREDVRGRSAQGFTTTYYVCCTPPRPNTFVFSAPVESRYLGWHAAAFGYDGFLRWAYDAWPADPVRDARHRLWPAGDCFLIYPGGYSSIRLEKLREGIVDYEKIRILRDLASRSSNGNAQTLMRDLEAHLSGLPTDRDYAQRDYDVAKVTGTVRKGNQLIEALSDELQSRSPLASAGELPTPTPDRLPIPAWFPKAPPLPSPLGEVIRVSTAEELLRAVERVEPGGTILLADGHYALPRVIVLEGKRNIVIRSASGKPARVTLSGQGWDTEARGDDLLHIARCKGVTIADLTLADCRSYGIKVEAENAPEDIHIYHCRFQNIGVRAIKGSAGQDPNIRARRGSVRYCHFENTKVPPADWLFGGDYISAVDMMALEDWIFSDNVFRNIKGRNGGGRAAIFIWVRSRQLVVERNLIIDCDRGIAFGNPGQSTANLAGERLVYVADGLIRNNIIAEGADCGIELWYADRIKVLHNTIWRPERNWSRGIRVGTGTGNSEIVNNLVHGEIRLDGGEAQMSHNQAGRLEGYFVDPATGDLALTPAATGAIDQGVSLPEVTDDIRRRPRTGRPDLGAWEFGGEGNIGD